VQKKTLETGVSLCRGPLGYLGDSVDWGFFLKIAGELWKGSV